MSRVIPHQSIKRSRGPLGPVLLKLGQEPQGSEAWVREYIKLEDKQNASFGSINVTGCYKFKMQSSYSSLDGYIMVEYILKTNFLDNFKEMVSLQEAATNMLAGFRRANLIYLSTQAHLIY